MSQRSISINGKIWKFSVGSQCVVIVAPRKQKRFNLTVDKVGVLSHTTSCSCFSQGCNYVARPVYMVTPGLIRDYILKNFKEYV